MKVVGVLAIVVATPVFGVSALRHLLRGLLWRVGSRLFVSYLLIGVLPLLLVAGLISAALFILAGQSGARRAETRLLARLDALEAKASEFAGRERARRPEAATGSGSFDGWALLPASGVAEGDGPLGTELGKIAVPEKGLRAFVRDGEKSFLLVGAADEGGPPLPLPRRRRRARGRALGRSGAERPVRAREDRGERRGEGLAGWRGRRRA